ncbi:hypothetical protein PI125_g3564 [Phytophthora idaei]|nr:hypothetical protein PI125_g3564 [Phytophthora idaei]
MMHCQEVDCNTNGKKMWSFVAIECEATAPPLDVNGDESSAGPWPKWARL